MADERIGDWLSDSMAGLPCRVLLPEPYEPQRVQYPLVVALHGSGERGTDNARQLKNGIRAFEAPERRRRFPCIVVAPQCPADDTFGGSWYGGSSRTQQAVLSLVRELGTRRSVDARRVYVIGFSMGAIGLWAMLERAPGLFAAAVPIAGDLDVERARDLVHFPLWAFHGEQDELVSNTNTRAFAALTQKLGGSARYTELPGVGHDAWAPTFARDDLYEWLFSQRRK
ncbi:MAG: PHB depolymerase family esterase [Myxococcaceae bacterium]|nr:PHB depolymerase family esterase [Myxococcaceae bacterium]